MGPRSIPVAAPTGQVVFSDPGVRIGIYGNVMLSIASGPASEASMRMAREVHRRLSSEYRDGYAQIIASSGFATRPSPQMRADMQELTKQYGRYFLAQAMVIEGDGLVVASLRMVMKSMLVALPSSHPMRAFGNLGEAARWVYERAGLRAQFDVPGLTRFAESLRSVADTSTVVG